VLKLNVAERASGDWIESSFRFAASELASGGVHSPVMLAKLAELLFMEAVREYLASRPLVLTPGRLPSMTLSLRVRSA